VLIMVLPYIKTNKHHLAENL